MSITEPFETPDEDRPSSDPANDSDAEDSGADRSGFVASIALRVTTLAGLQRVRGFSFRALFAEVFGRHTADDVEEFFTAGSPKTTPPIDEVDTSWPRPWIFFRAFLGTVVVYLLFDFAWRAFENITLVPGLIITGSFAIPLATLMFFFEVNVRRNVSIYQVAKLVVIGGLVSFIMSLILFGVSDAFSLGWLGSSIAGLLEEPGKIFALLIVASMPRYKYIHNGLLFGAAIGVGFAAFESAGYALFAGVVKSDASLMTTTILLRGLLSPFGHIAWSAMCGAALWRVKGADLFRFRMFFNPRFLRVFVIAIVLHMVWNAPLQIPFFGRYIIVGVVAWIIILGFIGEGLDQLSNEQAERVER